MLKYQIDYLNFFKEWLTTLTYRKHNYELKKRIKIMIPRKSRRIIQNLQITREHICSNLFHCTRAVAPVATVIICYLTPLLLDILISINYKSVNKALSKK